MVNLNFQGPFHFDDIDQKTGKIEKDGSIWDLKQSGIYVWGFEINQNFLPYYVGIASGGETNPMHISARIKTHYEGFYNLGKPSTYMKPKLNYIRGNGIDPLHSDPNFLKNYYGKRNFGVTWQKQIISKAYIKARFDYIHNYIPLIKLTYNQVVLPFRFIFAPILLQTEFTKKYGCIKTVQQSCIKSFLEHLETFTKYALKCNTVNMSGSIQNHCYINGQNFYEGINFCCDQIEVEINVSSTIAPLFNNGNGKIVAMPK